MNCGVMMPGALGGQGGAPSAESALREELVDELDARGVPGELIRSWAAQEARALAEVSKCGCCPLPLDVREAALRFLNGLADIAGLPQGTWLDAVLLLDLCYLSGRLEIEALPAVCAVLVGLLKKSANSRGHTGAVAYVCQASIFTQWLGRMGYRTRPEVCVEEVLAMEVTVLNALDWRINRPSVHSWMSALCDRFDILTNRYFTSSLEWIYAQSVNTAGMLVLRHAVSAEMSPQRMANGLLCTFLVMGRMLPLERLRPPWLSKEDWEDRFCRSQCQGTLPSCVLPPARWDGMLDLLRLVTGSELRTLQADTCIVVEAMLHVAVGMQSSPAQCLGLGRRLLLQQL